MRLIVSIIGWLIFAEGVLFLVRPEFLGPVIKFFSKGWRMHILSVARIIIAVLMFLGAIECRKPVIIIIFASVLLITGFVALLIKKDMVKSLLDWWQQRNLVVVRLLSAVIIFLGAVIIYSA
ncbi:MAG: hypothetical protein JW804_00510 [Sedimentisphaerales bacterium]|nr:hypothetical protein [Sedimentisphaerales bacterium]